MREIDHHGGAEGTEINRRGVAILSLIWTSVFVVAFNCEAKGQASDASDSARPMSGAIEQTFDELTRVELALEEATLSRLPLESVRDDCRTVISQLKAIDAQIDQLLRATYAKRPSSLGKNDWTIDELESLRRNLHVKLAHAYRLQSQSFAAGSPDRTNALALANEHLSQLVEQPLNEPAIWQARVEQLACLRLQNKLQQVKQQLEKWRQASPPPVFASLLSGEAMSLELQAGNIDRALNLVTKLQADDLPEEPATDDVILEVFLTARTLKEPAESAYFTQEATRQLRHIATAHGTYWKRRAEVRLGNALAESTDTEDPTLLRYAAASLYTAGKRREAVAIYDRIAARWSATSDAERQVEVRKTAAAIVRELNQPTEALARYRKLSLDHASHVEAAQLHLIAIGLAAELARNASAELRGERFELYLKLLREHLARWPQHTSSRHVQQWLDAAELPEIEKLRAHTLANSGERQEALALYRQLLQDSPTDVQLLEAYGKLLMQGTGEKELREALRIWRQIEQHSKPGGQRWPRGRRARLELLQHLGEGEQAEKLRQLTEILHPNWEHEIDD